MLRPESDRLQGDHSLLCTSSAVRSSISLVDIAHQAGSGYELAFFRSSRKRLNSLIETGV